MPNFFNIWNIFKQKLDARERNPHFRRGDIRWVFFGKNIQSEIYGKGKQFRRPAIILQSVFGDSAIIVPLTTKKHTGNYYFEFTDTKGNKQTAILPQIRYADSRRLGEKISSISKDDMQGLKKSLISIL